MKNLHETENLVAVYGSLRRGQKLNHCLDTADYFDNRILDGFAMIPSGTFFPYVFRHPDHQIVVELYNADRLVMEYLDRVEGVPNHYQRITVNQHWDGDEVLWDDQFEMYVVDDPHDDHKIIVGGDWVEYKNLKARTCDRVY